MPVFEWEGDLDHDCSLRVGDLLAHCECLNDSIYCVAEDKELNFHENFDIESWSCAVYRGDEVLFHSGEYGGMITDGDMARGICEAIVKAAK